MAININGSTGISGVNGSAGTPALQGGDANTGIAFGVDTVIVSTDGSERWRTDSTGKLLSPNGAAFYGTVNNAGYGAIMETGSNANGRFVKYADGTMICTYGYGAGNPATITDFGTFNYPATFTDAPHLSFFCRASTSGSPAPYAFCYTEPTATQYFPRVSNSGTYTRFYMTATGRWY